MPLLRRFTGDAMRDLRRDFDRFSTIGYADLSALLTDDSVAPVVDPPIDVEIHHHRSRFELADYLWQTLYPIHYGVGSLILGDTGLWTWLAFIHMDVIGPLTDGVRRIGEVARWIDGGHDRTGASRHLMLGPFSAYAAHSDDPGRAMCVLGGRRSEFSGLARELSGRRDLLVSPAVMAVATDLYVNPLTGLPRRGSAQRSAAGSLYRFVQVMAQFDLVYDLHSISPDGLRSLLPPEFDRWREDRLSRTP
jgi:hypothetical protein